jgi:hypothetical protein
MRALVPSTRRRRWHPSPARTVVVSVVLASVINLATNTVNVTWRWWPAVVWTTVVILLLASVSVEYSHRREVIAGTPTRWILQHCWSELVMSWPSGWVGNGSERQDCLGCCGRSRYRFAGHLQAGRLQRPPER